MWPVSSQDEEIETKRNVVHRPLQECIHSSTLAGQGSRMDVAQTLSM
jgi:hypothetical protein